jgi:hypothetical protein
LSWSRRRSCSRRYALHDPVGDADDLPAIDEVVVDRVFSRVRTQIKPEERAATERMQASDQPGHVLRHRALAKEQTGPRQIGGGITARRVGPVDDRRPVPAQQDVAGWSPTEAITVRQGVQLLSLKSASSAGRSAALSVFLRTR